MISFQSINPTSQIFLITSSLKCKCSSVFFSNFFPLFLSLLTLCCHFLLFSLFNQPFSSNLCDIIYSNPSLFLSKNVISLIPWIHGTIFSIHSSASFPTLTTDVELPFFFFVIPFHHLTSLVKNHFLTKLGMCTDSLLFPKAYL